jgi:S-disulfanyl-L-cysteine oxidoreductase SoxD
MGTTPLRAVGVGLVMAAFGFGCSGDAPEDQDPPPEREERVWTLDTPLFTSTQAARGERTFQEHCSICHGLSQLSGPYFQRTWARRSVGDLYSYIRSNMPYDGRGRLSREDYEDVLSYLLGLNGVPAGEEELHSGVGGLGRIRFQPEGAHENGAGPDAPSPR